MVFFDLPTETKKERKDAAAFRKHLVGFGFSMFQFSIYVRNCPTWENAQVHVKRVKAALPESGKVCILCVTEKQFAQMELFIGRKASEMPSIVQQLELF